MRIIDQKNFGAGLFYLLLGGFVALRAPSFGVTAGRAVGPGFFPLMIGILLAVIGVIVLAMALGRTDQAHRSLIGRWSLRPLCVVLGAVVLFALLLKPAGYFLASAVLLVAAPFAAGKVSYQSIALSVVILLPLSWFIFVFIVGLRLPLWPAPLFGG